VLPGFSFLGAVILEKKRVKCFVDGFNLYHAILDLGKNFNHLKWLNLHKLAEAFIKPTQEVLESVFYFTAYPTWLVDSIDDIKFMSRR